MPGSGELNVAIRTFWIEEGRLHFGTGGGITWDSDPEAEWRETELKARRLLAVASGELVGSTVSTHLAQRRAARPADRPAINASDHGLLVGDGVFETAKVVDGEAFALTRHLARLRRSADGLGLTSPGPTRSCAPGWPRSSRPTSPEWDGCGSP